MSEDWVIEVPLHPVIVNVYAEDLEEQGCATIGEYLAKVREDPFLLGDTVAEIIANCYGIGNFIDASRISLE